MNRRIEVLAEVVAGLYPESDEATATLILDDYRADIRRDFVSACRWLSIEPDPTEKIAMDLAAEDKAPMVRPSDYTDAMRIALEEAGLFTSEIDEVWDWPEFHELLALAGDSLI